MSAIAMNPDTVIVIDCSDNRVRLAVLFGVLLLGLTSPVWIGLAANFFFGTLLGL